MVFRGFPGSASGGKPACQCLRHKRWRFNPSLRKISMEEGTATHSSILVWRIPWAKEPGLFWATVHTVTKSQTQLK